MAEIKVKVRKSLSRLLGQEREIKDIKDLQAAAYQSGSLSQDRKTYFPSLLEFALDKNSFKLEMLGKNKINTEGLLGELVTAIQQSKKEIANDYGNPVIIEFRYKNFSAQFLSGHLARDEAGSPKAMQAVLDSQDSTMIRRLKVLRDKSIGRSINSAIDSDYWRSDETIGIWGKISSIKEEDVANALGFATVTKESEGIVPNGQEQQKCKATRVCIHSEEYQSNQVKGKALETFRMMNKLRGSPSFAIGIRYMLEIYTDDKEVSVYASDAISRARFHQLVELILRHANVKNLNDAQVEYTENRFQEDSWLVKKISSGIQKVSGFVSEKQEKISLVLAALGFPLIFAYLYLLNSNTMSLIELIGVILAILFVSASISKSIDALFNKIFSYLAAKFARIGVFLKKPSVRRVIDGTIFMTLVLLVASTALMAILGLLLVPIVVGSIFGIIILGSISAALLDKHMWNEIARERERIKDQFFSQFREDRPGLSEECIVRFEIFTCKKLRNPLRGVPTTLWRYATRKYPKVLTPKGVLNFGKKALKINAAK